MIRAKLRKGLREGTMSPGSLADDEKLKLRGQNHCAYCGGEAPRTADHMIPVTRLCESDCRWSDGGENLVRCCRRCNSSKGGRDLLEWWGERPLPLLVLRRYLKLAARVAKDCGQWELPAEATRRPVRMELLPVEFPPPGELTLEAG